MEQTEIIDLECDDEEELPKNKKGKKKKKAESIITAIVCADKNYGIGSNNNVLVNISEIEKKFSRFTSGGYIIVGHKTFNNMQISHLDNKTYLIISHFPTTTVSEAIPKKANYVSIDDVKEWLLKKREKKSQEKIAIFGGSLIYNELLPYCDYIYIAKIFKAYDNVDAYFPNLDDMPMEWGLCFASEILEYDNIKYQYRKYKNAKPIKLEIKKTKTKKKS